MINTPETPNSPKDVRVLLLGAMEHYTTVLDDGSLKLRQLPGKTAEEAARDYRETLVDIGEMCGIEPAEVHSHLADIMWAINNTPPKPEVKSRRQSILNAVQSAGRFATRTMIGFTMWPTSPRRWE